MAHSTLEGCPELDILEVTLVDGLILFELTNGEVVFIDAGVFIGFSLPNAANAGGGSTRICKKIVI